MTLHAQAGTHRSTCKWALPVVLFAAFAPRANGQVFVVGEKTATSELKTDFTPTDLQLPETKLSERGRRELIRNLEAEQGFAHRALPMGPGLTLRANGALSPGTEEYRKMIYDKGQAAAPGDRVAITAMEIKGDRIILDLNGGPYAKHRFLSHIQFNDNNVVAPTEKATGARITLLFKGSVPEISAPEVKALLEPVLDFGVKSSEQAYADTLPEPLKNAIAAHDVLVGMTHRMVLAALGAPDSKMREQPSGDPNGARYEEWIYGHVPKTVKFVRFNGDRVSLVEIAALGKPMEIHDKDEMAGYIAPVLEREIALGDRKPENPDNGGSAPGPAPTLRKPGEAISLPNGPNKVIFPDDPPKTGDPKQSDPKQTTTATTTTSSQLL
ncbi:hypothetical protein [Granulicella sp. dw_53]|uniref:hypothetical protein n=1 Tax=Granulicella sp. dw_53 TaxID=2719792 RepID=UPI001BD1ECDE|nr:hypothetical protein [Granulicella sp. dw_53]